MARRFIPCDFKPGPGHWHTSYRQAIECSKHWDRWRKATNKLRYRFDRQTVDFSNKPLGSHPNDRSFT